MLKKTDEPGECFLLFNQRRFHKFLSQGRILLLDLLSSKSKDCLREFSKG